MLRKILKNAKIIVEGKEIKKDSFIYYYMDEIKDIDKITDITDLGDKKNVEIMLMTDENYNADDPTKGEWFKIDTEKLIKYATNTFDKFEDGDYMDFMGSYGVGDLITGYLESEFAMKCFKTWAEYIGTMDGTKPDLNKV
tara:strand:- start:2230 stop:2649 length:420 start_codon:yes stop_codon:yes gene_type:complete